MAGLLAPTGLIVGRFIPPHAGHSHMIQTAASRVARLVVMVSSRAGERPPGDLRSRWLVHLHPDIHVVEVRHDLHTDFEDLALWEQWVALFQARWPYADGPHVVFSSEPYGSELGRRLGAMSVTVDSARTIVPVSGSDIRAHPAEYLGFLAPEVRGWVEQNWC